MALKSVYLTRPVNVDGRIRITEEEHRHLVVSRTEPGEDVEVFDGRGHVWSCVIEAVGKRETKARVKGERDVPHSAVELTLGQALIRTAAFELALEKAVEIGVTRIIPVAASRSNITGVRPERWQRIAVEAAKQSKRYHLPTIDAPIKFDQILRVPAASKILFAERDGGLLRLTLAGPPVLYLIGPEGGWTGDEMASARREGFHLVSLGPGILRSETAAIVGGALILYELTKGGFTCGSTTPNRLH